MEKIIILENILNLLEGGGMPYLELYEKYFKKKSIRKSEFVSSLKELKSKSFIDYEGTFDDNEDVILTRFGEEMLQKYSSYSRFLKSQNATKYDELVKWGKNNIVIVLLLLFFTLVGTIASLIEDSKTIVDGLKTDSIKVGSETKVLPKKPLKRTTTYSDPLPSSVSNTKPITEAGNNSRHLTNPNTKEPEKKDVEIPAVIDNDIVLSLDASKIPYSCGYPSDNRKEWIITNCMSYHSDGSGTGTMEKLPVTLPPGDYIVVFNIALGKFIPKDNMATVTNPTSEYYDYNISFKVVSKEPRFTLAELVLPYTNFSSTFKEVKLKFRVEERFSNTFLSVPIFSYALSKKTNEIRIKNITIKRIK